MSTLKLMQRIFALMVIGSISCLAAHSAMAARETAATPAASQPASNGPSADRQRVDQMKARHAALLRKYGDERGSIRLGNMPKEEREEFLRLEQALFRERLREQLGANVPSLEGLPKPPEGAFDPKASNVENPYPDSVVLGAKGDWRCVLLVTESALPVPIGWEIYEAGDATYLFYPPVEMTPKGAKREQDKEMVMIISTREAERVSDVRKEMFDESQTFMGRLKGMRVGPATEQKDGRGYFAAYLSSKDMVSVVVLSPVAQRQGMGFVAIATVPTKKWKVYGPVVAAMLSRWQWSGGQNVSVEIDVDAVQKLANAGAVAPTTGPATLPATKP